MQRQTVKLSCFRAGVFVFLAAWWGVGIAAAQMLPPASGATPRSAELDAEAHYIDACSNMVKSVAIARKINAEAVAIEIQNSVDYVKAYFERRRINREERAKENPNYLESEKKRQNVMKRRVDEQYQDLMRGDVTNTLNWLLRELSRPVVSYEYLSGVKSMMQPEIDAKLTERDRQLIRLTDGGSKASRLVFAAADGNVLLPRWPSSLRGDDCAAARDNFDRARDAVVKEIQEKGKISCENQTNLTQAVNGLFVALESAYPEERRKEPAEFLEYATGKRFVQSLVATVHRAVAVNDASVFSGNLRFQGDSLLGLLQHMYKNGLEFAPPEPGGEGIYKTLFQNLRSLYVSMGQDSAKAADAKAADAKDRDKDRDKDRSAPKAGKVAPPDNNKEAAASKDRSA